MVINTYQQPNYDFTVAQSVSEAGIFSFFSTQNENDKIPEISNEELKILEGTITSKETRKIARTFAKTIYLEKSTMSSIEYEAMLLRIKKESELALKNTAHSSYNKRYYLVYTIAFIDYLLAQ